MKFVLDASVAICWVIPRPLTPHERQKDIAVGQAAPLYAKVMNSPPVLIAHAPLIARAIDSSS